VLEVVEEFEGVHVPGFQPSSIRLLAYLGFTAQASAVALLRSLNQKPTQGPSTRRRVRSAFAREDISLDTLAVKQRLPLRGRGRPSRQPRDAGGTNPFWS